MCDTPLKKEILYYYIIIYGTLLTFAWNSSSHKTQQAKKWLLDWEISFSHMKQTLNDAF